MKTRILSFLLVICMLTSVMCVLPTSSFAAEVKGKSGPYNYTAWTALGIATIDSCDASASGNLVIPEYIAGCRVTDISSGAFMNNTSITAVTLPSQLDTLGVDAFNGCTNLRSVTFLCKLESLYSGTFANTGLTSVTVPDSVTYLGYGVFENCSSLTTAVLGKGVTKISGGLFKNATALKSVTVRGSIENIGYSSFENCSSLTSAPIAKTVTCIESTAFRNCTSLTSVAIPARVETIENAAFSGCSNLASVSFADGYLTKIGNSAFEDCYALKTLALPYYLSEIGSYAFKNCDSLTVVSGSAALTKLGYNTFGYCDSLTKVVLKSADFIDTEAFRACPNLREVWLPDNLTTIESRAFYETGVNNVIYGADEAKIATIAVGRDNDPVVNAPKTYNKPAFFDVNYTSWYVDALNYCTDKGYFSGTAYKTFSVKDALTRSQFVVVLAQLAGADLSGFDYMVFNDVPAGKWYTAAVAWANANGYASGIGNGAFGKNNAITREEIVVMFYAYAKSAGMNVSQKANLSVYEDQARIHSWAKEALEWGVASGLITGTSDTVLSPRGTVSRSQACQMFFKFDQMR